MKLDYFVAGTNNLEAAATFYDALFEKSGPAKVATTDRMVFWMNEDFAFAVATPFDEKPATNGNGTMFGFDAGSVEEVKRLHALAIKLGGSCEGEPGPRGPRFTGYVRDLDQNKLCFHTLPEQA
ncbi:VOC family protein [Tropicibacter sp. R15_0]|uniref:VOC family protein n=1 Tax=Tropicibacter sp. R15_0 TaxID=2821101 RepID=UPI001ADAB05C|nr:VOC family protein [Tropicibacter sp. R15_0]MBO9463791.1 VOC family protein [Tropicibacter sp. R15_0]